MLINVTEKELRERIRQLGPWFQNIRISGIQTAADHFLGDYPAFKWQGFKHVLPDDLQGCSVLDVGCNAGFYSMEMKRRNAGRVLGIDSDPRYLEQARFAAGHAKLDIEFRQMSIYDVGKLGERFDLVIFMGVLYHLRHPLLALDLLFEHVVGDRLLFQSLQRGDEHIPDLEQDYEFSNWSIFERSDFPRLYFVENAYAGDPTNWFIPNAAAVEAMLRSSGFMIEDHPEREVYLCRRGKRPYGVSLPP
jgi:tRNA (mo5U34)-methyltransferase